MEKNPKKKSTEITDEQIEAYYDRELKEFNELSDWARKQGMQVPPAVDELPPLGKDGRQRKKQRPGG